MSLHWHNNRVLHIAWASFFLAFAGIAAGFSLARAVEGEWYYAILVGIFCFPFGYMAVVRAKMAMRGKEKRC